MLLDMAEAIGCTADELAQRITEREINERLALGRPLWPRRLEILLAQLAWVAASVAGNRSEIGDFDIFGPRDDSPQLDAEDGAHALGAIAGGVGVRVLGKKRKKNADGK